jgi:hypothetical protein
VQDDFEKARLCCLQRSGRKGASSNDLRRIGFGRIGVSGSVFRFELHRFLSVHQAALFDGRGLTSRQTDMTSIENRRALMIFALLREIKKCRRGRPSFSGDGGRIGDVQAAILVNAGPS